MKKPKIQKKKKLILKIHSLDDILRGSVYEMKRFCGKKNCKCIRTDTPHKSLFLSFMQNGKTQLIPIKKNQVADIKKKIRNHKKLKNYINELIMINANLLRY